MLISPPFFSRLTCSLSRGPPKPLLFRFYPLQTSRRTYPVFAIRAITMTTPKPLGKRLIVSCDGTWQSADTGPGKDPTNAINFCRALTHNAEGDRMEQIIFYQAGVATGGLLPIQKTLSGMMLPGFFQCHRIDSGI
jgi:Uncharacterized alpha/beta hydrolase domain (DUF2235)